jgi:NTE family protein
MALLSGQLQAQSPLELIPQYLAWDALSRNLAPSDLNPLSFHPMRAPLEQLVDFEQIRSAREFPVMVCATHVLTAKRRVFTNAELSVDTILAAACRPYVHPAVEIEGEYYWDGAFTGSPAMTELIRTLPNCDLLILRTEPIARASLPRSPREIEERAMEISCSTASWLELSALAVIQRLAEEGWLDRERFGRVLVHTLDADAELERIPGSTRLNYSTGFLEHMFDLGRTRADRWLAANRSALGERSTLDLQSLLPVSADAFKRREPSAYGQAARSYAEGVRPRIKLYSPEPR